MGNTDGLDTESDVGRNEHKHNSIWGKNPEAYTCKLEGDARGNVR
jgi:hypothetical protein